MLGELNQEQIEEVLKDNVLGRIGCSNNNKSYIVPINYIYDGKFIVARSVEGMKINIMRKNPQVCFQVDEIKNFTNWKSVIVWGQYQEVTDEEESYQLIKLFVDRTLHMKISETAALPEINQKRIHPRSPGNIRPVIYRVMITEKTGRFESR